MSHGRMRVALLSFGRSGGTGQYPAGLANGIANHADCYALVPSTHTELDLYDDAVNLVEFPDEWNRVAADTPYGVGWALSYPPTFAGILRRLRAIDPDVVHLPFYFLLPSIVSVPLVKALDVPVVATVHDPRTHDHGTDPDDVEMAAPFEWLPAPLKDRVVTHEGHRYGVDVMAHLRRLPSRLIDRVVVHGEGTYRQAVSVGYDEESLRVIPHGAYDQFGRDDGMETGDTPTVLFFGNLRKYRGTDRLPDIADALAERRDDFRIRVAGAMDDARRGTEWGQRTLDALRDHPRIDFTAGYVPSAEVKALFDEAAVVVLPYYDASMSGVVMTAYSFATPIVATDAGDLGWMVEKDGAGLVAEPNSVEAIADALDRLLSDGDLRARARENIRAARDQYRWENVGATTVELYAELVDGADEATVETPPTP